MRKNKKSLFPKAATFIQRANVAATVTVNTLVTVGIKPRFYLHEKINIESVSIMMKYNIYLKVKSVLSCQPA